MHDYSVTERGQAAVVLVFFSVLLVLAFVLGFWCGHAVGGAG